MIYIYIYVHGAKFRSKPFDCMSVDVIQRGCTNILYQDAHALLIACYILTAASNSVVKQSKSFQGSGVLGIFPDEIYPHCRTVPVHRHIYFGITVYRRKTTVMTRYRVEIFVTFRFTVYGRNIRCCALPSQQYRHQVICQTCSFSRAIQRWQLCNHVSAQEAGTS